MRGVPTKGLVLMKVPKEFLQSQILNDAKDDLRKITNKTNVEFPDALRYLGHSYNTVKKLSFEKELNKK